MKRIILPLLILVVMGNFLVAQNPRNVLIYNLTSTGCGPCSCMDSILGRIVLPAYPQTIVVALHGMGSHFANYQGDSVYMYFDALYDPSGFIDGLGYDVPHVSIKDSVASRYTHNPEAPVKIQILTKSWNPVTRKVDFTLNMTNLGNELPGSYRLNVIVTENNIKFTHRVAEGCARADDPSGQPIRHEYFNSWVTRSLVYYTFGDSLIGPSWPAQQTLTRACSFPIDTAWVPQNCNFVVVVYKNADSLYKARVQQAIQQSVTNGIGIGEVKPVEDGPMTIHPNPCKGPANIHFSVGAEGSCRLDVFDLQGRMVENLLQGRMNPGFYNVETDTRNYPAGVYILVLNAQSGLVRTRFVVP
ncbi:MAG: Omp28-related outer membrane protein [Bacteroidota bacterium]